MANESVSTSSTFPQHYGSLLAMRGGQVGRYEGRCALTQKHRVTTYKRQRTGDYVHPKHIGDGKDVVFTVWLIAENIVAVATRPTASTIFSAMQHDPR